MESNDNWKSRTILLGLVIGAVAGLGAAYMLVQQAEKDGRAPEMSPGEGVKLGLLVLGALRQIAQLGEGRGG
ncbi:MAG TPA: hypothetical protein VMN57_02415 [Anaerolineales bacterium]|nr:hypothetical protein [Anaerolineales bacterium]